MHLRRSNRQQSKKQHRQPADCAAFGTATHASGSPRVVVHPFTGRRHRHPHRGHQTPPPSACVPHRVDRTHPSHLWRSTGHRERQVRLPPSSGSGTCRFPSVRTASPTHPQAVPPQGWNVADGTSNGDPDLKRSHQCILRRDAAHGDRQFGTAPFPSHRSYHHGSRGRRTEQKNQVRPSNPPREAYAQTTISKTSAMQPVRRPVGEPPKGGHTPHMQAEEGDVQIPEQHRPGISARRRRSHSVPQVQAAVPHGIEIEGADRTSPRRRGAETDQTTENRLTPPPASQTRLPRRRRTSIPSMMRGRTPTGLLKVCDKTMEKRRS